MDAVGDPVEDAEVGKAAEVFVDALQDLYGFLLRPCGAGGLADGGGCSSECQRSGEAV